MFASKIFETKKKNYYDIFVENMHYKKILI